MALITTGGGLSEGQATYDAAKAYAVSLSAFLTDPSFEGFVSSQLESARAEGLVNEGQIYLLTATFRIALLIHAMATLYKAETGGVTGQEIMGLIDGTVPVEESNYLRTLSTLVNESLKTLPGDIGQTLIAQLLQNYDQQLQIGSVTEPIRSFLNVWKQNLSSEASTATPA